MVFYRKYRPQAINELDSASVRETLFSVLSQDPPHAFLFTGPKGLGKTSTARIVAKTINCTNLPSGGTQPSKDKKNSSEKTKEIKSSSSAQFLEPCNKCDQCLSITAGTNMDVIEIDAASNRGIDEIRDLREKIWLAPLKARKKIYIIDEVHMLTTEAFNALLKTLEEPPSHAMFILCTTEVHKIPATIASRCFHINFRKATNGEIVRSLERIKKGEGLNVDDEVLQDIASMSDGGFREAAKIFEEFALIASGQKITKDLIRSKIKTTAISDHVNVILLSLKQQKDLKQSLASVQEVVEQGIDLKYFVTSILDSLHNQLLEQAGIKAKEKSDPYQFTIDEIKQLSELFSKAIADMRFSVLPQLPLELAIIEFHATPPASSSQPVSQEDSGNNSSARPHSVAQSPSAENIKSEVTVDSLRKQQGAITKIKALYGDQSKDTVKKTQPAAPGVELLKIPADGELTKEWLDTFWKSIIAEIKQHNHTIAGVLRSCALKSYDRKKLIIQTSFNFHKERLDDHKSRDALLLVCKNLTGNEVEIEVQLKK